MKITAPGAEHLKTYGVPRSEIPPSVRRRRKRIGPVINKQGQKIGPKRGSRHRFPYEPRIVCGRLLMPAELQAIHRYLLETPVVEEVTEEIRAAVETIWPDLISKLPPKRLIWPPVRLTELGSVDADIQCQVVDKAKTCHQRVLCRFSGPDRGYLLEAPHETASYLQVAVYCWLYCRQPAPKSTRRGPLVTAALNRSAY